jgi:hypothetical protein
VPGIPFGCQPSRQQGNWERRSLKSNDFLEKAPDETGVFSVKGNEGIVPGC